jgi:alpha-L-arabinofuranosidase
VNSSGTDPNGERYDYLNGELRKMNADLIDEHYYKTPEWFLQNAGRYDTFPRIGSKVFAGEYAAHSKLSNEADKKNNWESALAEAAFMTGLERNADVVYMASYAPLLAHIDGWQWAPDLIWFNNLQSYGTPNYYVQKLFSTNKGSQVVPVLLNNSVVAGVDSLFASASIDKQTNELIIKLVNASAKEYQKDILAEGVKQLAENGSLTVLSGGQLNLSNSFSNSFLLLPKEVQFNIVGNKIPVKMAPYSLNIIRVKLL